MHACGFLPAVTGNRSHGKTGQIADSGRNHIAGQHLADDVLIAAVCGDGGIDDSSFQQAGKKPSGDCQVIALFSISFQLQRFNDAYVLGCGEGNARKRTTFCSGTEPTYLDRYEVYVDERNTAQEEDVTDAEYLEILKSSGAEHLVQPKTASESAIAAFSTQYQYNKDYFVGDYVTVEQRRFGLIQPRIQLIGMVESFDQNGRSLTPTFKETE